MARKSQGENNVDVLGIIPARGGSKGIPGKNLRLLGDKPLIEYSIDAARKCTSVDEIVVTTNDPEIADFARNQGIRVIERPDELAQDATPMAPVVRHALEEVGEGGSALPEITVLLQPTAPLRQARHIDEALQLMIDEAAGSVVSVSSIPGHFNPEWQLIISNTGDLERYGGGPLSEITTRRQDLPATYFRNGAIYAFRTADFLASDNLYIHPCKAYRMAARESVNIDSEADLLAAEYYLQKRDQSG